VNELALLVDLHRYGRRQGPGGDEETRLAIRLSGLQGRTGLHVADVGCGTGASTLVLARELNATVTAVDLLPELLEDLQVVAAEERLSGRIETLVASMDDLPFEDRSLDAIWSEGAIYNMGFENGVRSWRRYLERGGILAVSDLTWLTRERPPELEAHWMREYPEVATASTKLAILEANGFSPIGYFPLPDRCWLDHYYDPMRARFEGFLARHARSDAAVAMVAAEEREIDLYERHRAFVSYGFYLARKTDD
jgi:SAM-dependent methyltransferase